MIKTTTLAIVVLAYVLSGVVAPTPDGIDKTVFSTTEAVVLKQGDILQARQAKRFHANRCEVRLQGDGSLVVSRLVAPNPWYQQYRPAWTSGSAANGGSSYRATLDSADGSLLVIQEESGGGETIVYTSNLGEPEALDGYMLERVHKLVITEECVLQMYRDDRVVWTNNRFGGLGGEPGISSYLQKGEMFHVNQCYRCGGPDCIYFPQTLLLQHDCNLVQFVGRDLADMEDYPTPLWTSRSSRPDLEDCYLYADEDKVRLYEGKLDKSLLQFAPRAGASYWKADDDFMNPCSGGYEVLLKVKGGLEASC